MSRVRQAMPSGHEANEDAEAWTWLEDPASDRAAAWLAEQSAAAEAYFSSTSTWDVMRRRLAELWNYPYTGTPYHAGGSLFQVRRTAERPHGVLYQLTAAEGTAHPVLDPADGATGSGAVLAGVAVSQSSTLLGYGTATVDTDTTTWRVRDLGSGQDLGDQVEGVYHRTVAWNRRGTGFYYCARTDAGTGPAHSGSRPLGIWFHRLSDVQADDELVFTTSNGSDSVPAVSATADGRFIFVTTVFASTTGARIHVLDQQAPEAGFQLLADDDTARTRVVSAAGEELLAITDFEAANRRLIALRPGGAGLAGAREILAPSDHLLVDARLARNLLVCHFQRHAQSVITLHQLGGKQVGQLPIPAGVSVRGFSAHPGSTDVYLETTSFTDPGTLWHHDTATSATRRRRGASPPGWDPDAYVSEQVFVRSHDGIHVPMFLVRRRDVAADGAVPVLMYAYGSFGFCLTPAFRVPYAVWLESGGALAIVNVRGGGEYGAGWHEAGRQAAKDNGVRDLLACARWLVASGWSQSPRIAVTGDSAGALLAANCLIREPGRFGAAVVESGVLDLLGFHRLGEGWLWRDEFGDPDDPSQREYLHRNSPLHNIPRGIECPPTLIIAGAVDERVPPAHSFKFAAALKAAQGGPGPILLRVAEATGHEQGRNIETRADLLAFLYRELAVAGRTPRSSSPAGRSGTPGATGRGQRNVQP
jgi:prolyl oligopeptidase